MLPASYALSQSLLNIDRLPVASGGPGDVYGGRLEGLRVCVKRVRVYSEDDPEKAAQVRCYFIASLLPLLTIPTALPGSRDMETRGTQKYLAFTWYHSCSTPAHF